MKINFNYIVAIFMWILLAIFWIGLALFAPVWHRGYIGGEGICEIAALMLLFCILLFAPVVIYKVCRDFQND